MVRRLQSPKLEVAESNLTDQFEKMADLLAQMHKLESILKATKTELAFLEGKENAPGLKENAPGMRENGVNENAAGPKLIVT
jgi:hypothetical protein